MNNDNKITTCYGPIDQHIVEKARLIKLLICDVDGVMTDGLIYMGNNGEELKAFNVKDGYGIRCLLTSAIEVAIITGRKAKLLEDRAKTLGINYLYQGQSEKKLAYNDLITRLKLQPQQIAYIGDDLIDWPVMSQIGLSVAVADAHPMLLSKAHYVTYQAGGKGAVREICDLILLAQDKIENAHGLSI
ncbi:MULTISPECIES: 3-deoxy-manno-octulosonate-8-phosphatase KdsC [Arsenophonus]|uniref:3-deoxy-manno-octulosonate-8-phosphatase KdsC n=1 Tax=Arsenophonus TaxID=637 RepID=UPI0005099AAE|nr:MULTISPECIES: 3-deoxy-manno-octulosonate-8-phosphatase KdsC [Arsenophonus]MDR5616555.1 3-deoxy-manno-octulosonate-8-phosphatase KdsC [Arsenophonus sp.]